MILSVIIPAYNEEKNLDKNIKEFTDYLEQNKYEYELIIINDGSEDKTSEIAINLIKSNKKIKLIDNKVNKGKGFAIKEGMLKAEGDLKLFLDADNATSIDNIEKAIPFFKEGADIVIASRNNKDIPGTEIEISQSLFKVILGRVGNTIIRKIVIPDIFDTQCGFKVFSKKSSENIFSKTTINRWGIDIEILTIAKEHKYKINIIPINWVNSKESRVKIKSYFNTLKELFIIKNNLKKGKYK